MREVIWLPTSFERSVRAGLRPLLWALCALPSGTIGVFAATKFVHRSGHRFRTFAEITAGPMFEPYCVAVIAPVLG